MELKILNYELTVCKVNDTSSIDLDSEFFFAARTDEEISLVCKTSDVPSETIEREDGWRGFRITGVLDFGLIGILSKISGILADNGIGIFAVSTYNTDYILVKEENFDRALSALSDNGYNIT
ncbi:MAG: ACT domain-containing protein [Clostridiales bacterium]|nr:ACT domain-containing protein [Clostridiales bacterium]